MEFDPSDPENLLFARPAEYWKIFISSKMADGALQAERAAAIEAVEAFPLTRAWAWERSANAGPYSSERECIAQAGTSDGLVLILADELTGITRKEFEAARRSKAPLFVMLKAGANRDPGLQEFITRVRDSCVTANFSSLGELKTQITRGLRSWALRSGRSAMLTAADTSDVKPAQKARSRKNYENVEIIFGEKQTRIGDILAKARQRVRDDDAVGALEDLLELAQLAREVGLGWVALETVDEVKRIVPAEAIDDRWRGWILNTMGLALSDAERSAEAVAAFERMRQLGRALGDPDLESTALQNLGVQNVITGDADEARRQFRRSIQIKVELGDWRGSLQVLFNTVNVLIGKADLDAAEELLADLSELMVDIRDPALRNTLHGLRGTLAVERKDFQAARRHFREALRAARRAGSTPRMIRSMQNLGSTAADLGEPAQARRWYTKALELAEAIDDLALRRTQRQALALSHMRLGDPTRAAALFEQAADEAAELGDCAGAAVALGDAGACLLQAGDPRGARTRTEHAISMPSDNDDDWRAGQLSNLAVVLEELAEPEAALQRLQEAANLYSAIQDQANALRRAGELAIEIPTLAARAPDIFNRELDLRKGNEIAARWAWRAAEIGATLNHTAQATHARDFFSKALRVFARRSDQQRQACFTRNDRALASADIGDLSAAARDLRKCVDIAGALEDRALMQQAHMNLGEIERRRGHMTEATSHLEKASALAGELEDVRLQGETASLRALLAQDSREWNAAEQHLAAVDRIAQELKDPSLRAQGLKGRAHLEFMRGRYGKASQLYSRAAGLLAREGSRQLAESLGGQISSSAWRGRLEVDSLEQVVELSEHLDWDNQLVDDLVLALDGLATSGNEEDVAELAAIALAVATRQYISAEISVGDESSGVEVEGDVEPLSRVAVGAARWIFEGQPRSSARQSALRGALEKTFGTELAPEIGALVDIGVAQFAKATATA